jgi:uncharacterized membrane protein YeaQ/YmgE (transglycosylase-associated protein family)
VFDFWTFLYLLIVGFIVGYLARLLVRGRDPMTWWQTILLGVVGSFVGGTLGYLLFGFDEDEGWLQPGGIIGSLVGAILALLIWRAVVGRRQRGAVPAPAPSSPAQVAAPAGAPLPPPATEIQAPAAAPSPEPEAEAPAPAPSRTPPDSQSPPGVS